jgi:hypothetical protein
LIEPTGGIQKWVFNLVETSLFENLISASVGINIVGLCMEYYNAPAAYEKLLAVMNIVFVVVFIIEAILKIIGYG